MGGRRKRVREGWKREGVRNRELRKEDKELAVVSVSETSPKVC